MRGQRKLRHLVSQPQTLATDSSEVWRLRLRVWSQLHGLVVAVDDDRVLNSRRQLIYIWIQGKSGYVTSLVIFDR